VRKIGLAGDGSGESSYDWSAIAAAEVQRVEIPEGEREAFAAGHTLRGLYEHVEYGLEAQRLARVTAGTLAAGTVAKDRQAIKRWERYSPRPADWPDGQDWEGRPLAWITDQHVQETLAAMRKELSGQSVRTTWNHLRTIFLHAVQVKALEKSPEPTWGKGDAQQRATKELYDDKQLEAIYLGLAGQVDLQVAFVVSVNVGPRTVDLFRLRWENFLLQRDRPVVEYTARKTGKRHVVPLGPVTVRQLERWRQASGALPVAGESGLCGAGGLVWPELTDAGGADPERSRAARARNARFKRMLSDLGLMHEKPWQVGRLTCNERLERHRPGSGQFVLGHSNTLNSVSYREPSGLIYEAVTTLPQPVCFQV